MYQTSLKILAVRPLPSLIDRPGTDSTDSKKPLACASSKSAWLRYLKFCGKRGAGSRAAFRAIRSPDQVRIVLEAPAKAFARRLAGGPDVPHVQTGERRGPRYRGSGKTSSSGRTRTYNPSVNSRRLRPGVPLLSTECRGLRSSKWSPFGARLDQILDQAAAGR